MFAELFSDYSRDSVKEPVLLSKEDCPEFSSQTNRAEMKEEGSASALLYTFARCKTRDCSSRAFHETRWEEATSYARPTH